MGGGGWFPLTIREPYTGAWQENHEITVPTALSNPFRLRLRHAHRHRHRQAAAPPGRADDDGIWKETTNAAFSPVLRKPNRYQTTVKFVEQWITSKLTAGNTYVLKQRDERGVVVALYVLDPARVEPLVAPDGASITA